MMKFLIAATVAVALAQAQKPKIATDGKDMELIPPSGGTVKFRTGKLTTSVSAMLAADEAMAAAIAAAAQNQSDFADATDKQLKSLQATLDTDLKAQINSLQTSLTQKVDAVDRKLTETKNKLETDTAAAMTKASKAVDTKLSNVYTKKETNAALEAQKPKPTYCGTPIKGFTPVKGSEADVKAGRIYVGMMFSGNAASCGGKGTFLSAPTIYCTSSKRFCANPTYCPTQVKPSCGKCMKDCDECTSSTTCSKCKTGTMIINGKCAYASSCLQFKPSLGQKDGAHFVKLMSTKGNKVVDATCIFEGGRAHTNILCTKFTGKCQRFSRFNQGNTCRTYGYEVTPFRNRKHFTMIYDKWGYNTLKSYTYSAHIYKTGGGGRYTGCAMKKGSCGGWRAYDGKDWWLRDTTYGEPNGDYSGWCHLHNYGWSKSYGFMFNDGGCYHSGDRYVCGTSDYDK